MTKQEILDYIMKTPYNINWNVLEYLLEDYSDDVKEAIYQYVTFTPYNMNRLVLEGLLEETIPDTYMTTLYTDGTFIINEPSSKRAANIAAHGEVTNEYDAWDGNDVTYDFKIQGSQSSRPWKNEVSNILTVKVGSQIKPTCMAYWFYQCTNVTNIDLDNIDTSEVVDMDELFCNCYKLESLNISNFDTSNVTNMYYMFCNCRIITDIDLSSFDTSSVETMEKMFYDCNGLKSLDLSSFDTSNVTNMNNMFGDCDYIVNICVSDTFVVSQVTNSTNMFFSCTALIGGAGTTYNSSYRDKTRAKIDSGSNDQGYFTLGGEYYTTLYIDGTFIINEPISQRAVNITTHGAITAVYSAWNGTSITYDFDGTPSKQPWYGKKASITKTIIGSTIEPTTTNTWFNGFTNCTDFDLTNLNTSNVTNMSRMFEGTQSVTNLNLSNFNTSKVTTMSTMFSGCHATNINVSSFDTTNVTNIGAMFKECTSITSLDLSSFNTSNVTSVSSMFWGCTNLVTIYVSTTFDVSNASGSDVFKNCTNLVGGAGTVFNSSYTGSSRAKIDGGVGKEGYFTAAS